MLRHWRVRSSLLLALMIALLAPLPGCDRNDEAPPPIVIVTPAPVRGVIAETSYAGFESGSWVAFPIPLSDGGQLDVTVDWTHDDSWIYVYLGETECDPVRLTGGNCPFLVASETQNPKPRFIESDVLDAGTYYLYLHNVPSDPATGVGSDRRESVRIVIGLTIGLEAGNGADPPRIGAPMVVSPTEL